ncbi:MAG: hypothetical protein HW414_809 [Dehalococcoidia bacterium]|nr:hypothetical protein [Dehalococcoidia bacterium]
MTFLRLAIEARRLDLAAYALVHSAATVLARQTGRRAEKEGAALGGKRSPKRR